MEQIVRTRTYPELESHPPRLRLSPLVTIVFIMLVGFAVVTMGVRMLAQYTISPSNPFPAYADVLPGQPQSGVEAQGFSCITYDHNYYSDPVEQHCVLYPAIGIFSDVEVIISEGIIRQITFILRDNTLQVGDLAMFLEIPEIHTFYRVAYFFLPEYFIMVETSDYAGRFSYFLPVWNVSFTQFLLEH